MMDSLKISRRCLPPLTQIYMYQDSGPYIICGDFNARCGNDSDFIEGVDEVPERETVDFRKNSYGEIFLDFLIKSNCAMLNGRCNSKVEFTSVSTKGLAVVDYVIVSHDLLHACDEIKTISAADLFMQAGLVGFADMKHNISDHSLLCWNFNLNICCEEPSNEVNEPISVTKYDVTNIPVDFMCDGHTVDQMSRLIDTCTSLDNVEINIQYEKFCSIVKKNMIQYLPSKQITITENISKRYRHTRKPWWSAELDKLWNVCCKSEKMFINSKSNERANFKVKLLNDQRNFDNAVKDAKRQYQALETYRISYLLFFRTCVTLFRLRPELQPSDTIYGHIHRNSIFHTTFKD